MTNLDDAPLSIRSNKPLIGFSALTDKKQHTHTKTNNAFLIIHLIKVYNIIMINNLFITRQPHPICIKTRITFWLSSPDPPLGNVPRFIIETHTDFKQCPRIKRERQSVLQLLFRNAAKGVPVPSL